MSSSSYGSRSQSWHSNLVGISLVPCTFQSVWAAAIPTIYCTVSFYREQPMSWWAPLSRFISYMSHLPRITVSWPEYPMSNPGPSDTLWATHSHSDCRSSKWPAGPASLEFKDTHNGSLSASACWLDHRLSLVLHSSSDSNSYLLGFCSKDCQIFFTGVALKITSALRTIFILQVSILALAPRILPSEVFCNHVFHLSILSLSNLILWDYKTNWLKSCPKLYQVTTAIIMLNPLHTLQGILREGISQRWSK